MLKKIFKPIGASGASALIAVTTFLSYAAGLLRDRIIAVNFGTTSATDTYNASFLIPDALFNMFIAGALVAAFMPVFSEYLHKDKKEAFAVANTVLTGASILIGILAIISFIFMGHIVEFLFPNVSPESKADIITMTRMMLPAALVFSISNTIGNILMTYNRFGSFAISPILYNLGIIIGVVFFNEQYGIYSAPIGVVIGTLLHLVVRIVDVFLTEYRYKPELKIAHPGFKKIVKLMIPKAISLVSWQINLYIFAIVGMKMMEGGLAAFNFARNIQSFAVSLFGVAFATAVFPVLNRAVNQNDKVTYTRNIQTTIQRILFFTIPAAFGIILLSKQVTGLILSGGVFKEDSLNLTSLILTSFALSIPLESLIQIFSRAFYAIQNTFVPMIINVLSLFIIAMITIFVAPRFGIQWFSLGFTIGFLIYNILFIIILRKHLQGFDLKEFFASLLKIAVSTGTMCLGINLVTSSQITNNLGIEAILAVIVGGTIFMTMSLLLKSPELSSIGVLARRILKKRNEA